SYVDEPGVLLRMIIETSSGIILIKTGDGEWKSSFEDEDNFVEAKSIRSVGEKPYRIPEHGLTFNPAAYFKKEFSCSKKIKTAFVYCSSLGLYHLEINNKKISEDNLLPGWTDFNKRVYYNAYNVTSIITAKNNINIILADGYYSGYCGWEKGRGYYGKYPALKFQLMITYEDGSEEIIISDESWESSEGPIKEADILMGEFYDANIPINNYKKVIVVDDINPLMTNYNGNMVKQRMELKSIKIQRFLRSARNDENIFIVDFGQNFAGYVRLKLNNQKVKVVLRFAEVLNDDGSLYVDNIRMARATDTFISNGESEEIWEPLFTYHGFRYVEVEGLDEIKEDTITGISINSLEEQTGFFKSSNEKLNKLFNCILWNQRSNYIDIPTDCPQRDERFGWTGDAIIEFPTAVINFDMASFYAKWFQIFYDNQRPNGQLPPFSPAVDMGVGPIFYNSAGWADAGIIALYEFYKAYNDKRILELYYDKMRLFISSLVEQSDDFILPEYGYGDWLSSEETSKSFIATAFFAYDAYLMKEISNLLEHTDDAIIYNDLLREIRYSFKQKFLNNNYELKDYTQTAAVLSLYFNLLGIDGTKKAGEYLIKDIIKRNYHTSTGFLGLSFLMPVLSSLNRNDIAWKVLTNNHYPSWFFMIDNGATTLWERWDSYHPKKGFFDPTMNSFNHCSLGCIGEWLYTGLAGIKSLSTGFKKVRIEPYIPEELTFIEASYKSIYGTIKSNWKKENNKVVLNVSIPFNTFAEIVLPVKDYKIISGNNYVQKENTIEAGSGNYIIEYFNN
ncbi:MAG: family 78 glycoside hydrolase catalytic domain, partial [Syntrophothermus sp.]